MPPDDLDLDLGPDSDLAAAELALGLIEGDELAAARRRQLAEPGFAREVETWRAHFAGLFAQWPEAAPDPALGHRIAQRIDAPGGAPVQLARPDAGGWRALALGASAAAAVMLGVVAWRPSLPAAPVDRSPASAQPLVAALAPAGPGAPLAAMYDPASATVRMPGPMTIPAGHDAQLWLIEGQGKPQPLGLFHQIAGATFVATAKTSRPIAAGSTLAISIEPIGGSPTGQPTGPVVASGALGSV